MNTIAPMTPSADALLLLGFLFTWATVVLVGEIGGRFRGIARLAAISFVLIVSALAVATVAAVIMARG